MANGLVDPWGNPISEKGRPAKPRRKMLRWGAISAVILAAIPIAFSYWQMRATRSAYHGPWLRFEYYVCTGPYNNKLEIYQQLPSWIQEFGPTQNDLGHIPKDFVIHNNVYSQITAMYPEGARNSNRNSQVTFVWLKEKLLDQLTGLFEPTSTEIEGRHGERSAEEIQLKLRHYFEYLKANRPTVRLLHDVQATPPWVDAIPPNDPLLDEEVDLTIGRSPHSDEIIATAYFRSIRTIHLRIENVSPFNLTGIEVHLESKGNSQSGLAIGRGKLGVQSLLVKVPNNVLIPHEAIVIPLSVSLIPHLEASSMLMGSSEDVKEKWGNEDRFDEAKSFVSFLSSANQKTLAIAPYLRLGNATFHVADEEATISETRAMANTDLLQVSQTCECGSCPVLFARSKNGGWIRLREILTEAKGRGNDKRFEAEIPESADEMMISENRGESTLLTRLDVIEEEKSGRALRHTLDVDPKLITDRQPLRIDLHPYNKSGKKLTLAGDGYYVSDTDVLCPFVYPLPSQWVEEALKADRVSFPR